MRNLHFKKIKKDKQIRNELQRAHLMIALLAVGLLLIIGLAETSTFSPNLTLSTIMMVLLAVIALISISVTVALSRK